MARVKSPAARKHRKILKAAKGFKTARRIRHKLASEALKHAKKYAYAGRKKRKRDFRKLWIVRLNAAARQRGLSYSKFIAGLKKANIKTDRKTLSNLAISNSKEFDKIVQKIKAS